ncbi:RNA polymerase factor sigma-54 [Thetidibacter halocola]|uniref:RNA polymerase sigma-54 factor n=1 Tax=Thetidibacter halocola TaxID=2827239 RepID=A0A8J7WE80_9RHOB|nr:RNA polymerase sigma-54 factor [Thetidibacter halocola]MBS0125992.1 RNA polymerase sigma-54 factor [Thetidibacter halocola]
MVGIDLGLKQRGVLAMTPVLRQAIGFLALSNTDLSARLADLQTQNESLVAVPAAEAGAWLDLMRQVAPPTNRAARLPPDRPYGAAVYDTDRIAAGDPGLIAHVTAQLPLLVRNKADWPLAEVFLRALEPSGWLGADLSEIATEARVPVARAEAVLVQLQAAEPTGLFARSLAECLRLQAAEEDLLTPAFGRMLDHLPLLAAGDIEALAEACGCAGEEVRTMARALRQMNPKPGAAFSQTPVSERPPDLILRRDGEGWLVELNGQTAPALTLAQGAARPETLREARSLVQALERRHATVLAIASEIIRRQDAYLRGQGPLAALTINDLAAASGLHRSTVSRVTAALHMRTPRRTLCLRELMCASAPAARQQEDPMSVQAVLERMREIVAAEDPAQPLSDAAIAERLLPEGAALARRTVAKYRGLAGIPPRAARRRA